MPMLRLRKAIGCRIVVGSHVELKVELTENFRFKVYKRPQGFLTVNNTTALDPTKWPIN
jgi:hypothetical protein